MRVPTKVSGYRSKIINDTLDYLTSLTPLTNGFLTAHQTPNGTYWDLNKKWWPDGGADPYHFETTQTTAADAVKVRCGIWTICVGPEEYDIGLTCDDAAAHSDGEYYKTVGSIAASGYIIGTLTGGANPGSTQPTTLAASWSATYPDKNTTSPIAVFAKVTVTSGVITDVEPLWRGGDITDKPTVLDNLSLNYITAAGVSKNRAQTYGWDTAAGCITGIDALDLFEYQEHTTRAKQYRGWSVMITEMGAGLIAGPWAGSGAPWLTTNPPAHENLTYGVGDPTGAGKSANTDHDDRYPLQNGTYNSAHGKVYFDNIGNSVDDAIAIDLTKGALQLAGAWTATTSITSPLHDIDAANSWNAATFKAGSTGNAELTPTVNVKLSPGAELDLDVGTKITIDGTDCTDLTNAFKKGLFVGAGFSLVPGVYLYNNQGIPIVGPVSVLVKS